MTIAEAGLHVLDSTDSTLSSAVQGGGGGWEEGFPAPAPPPHQRQCGPGAAVGAALLLFSQQHGLSCCHTVISVICVKDCGAKVQVPVYTEEEEVAALQDRFLM